MGYPPLTYRSCTTRMLLDIARNDHGRVPRIDGKGRLVLCLIEWKPVPPDLMRALLERKDEVAALLAASKAKKAPNATDAG